MATDITITRTLTINTGNYQSIKPSISLTIKDCEIAGDTYEKMAELADAFLKLEIYNNTAMIKEIEKDGLSTYCKNIEKEIDNLEKVIINFDLKR